MRRADRLAVCRPARVWTTIEGRIVEASPEAQALLKWRGDDARLVQDFFPSDREILARALVVARRGEASTLVLWLHPYDRAAILAEVAIAPTSVTEEICWTFTRLRPVES